MDDDFAQQEPEQKTLLGGEGDKSEEEASGGRKKPKKTAGGGRPKKQEKPNIQSKQCLVASCNDDCVKGSKFCQPHKRSAQNMQYQAQAQSKEALKVVQDILADDSKAGIEVEKFSKITPPQTNDTRARASSTGWRTSRNTSRRRAQQTRPRTKNTINTLKNKKRQVRGHKNKINK